MLWLAFLVLLYGYLEAQFVKVRRDTVFVEGLPPRFERLTILHLADLHLSRFGMREKRLCRILREMDGDLAAFTGDYKARKRTREEPVREALRRISGCLRPRFGKVGVLGNKDSQEMLEAMEGAGIEVLSGRARRLAPGKDAPWIAGIDSVPLNEVAKALIPATASMPEESFRILLSHGPDVVRLAGAMGYSLVLCGDTHGGQIRLPLIGAPVVKSKLSRRYCKGIIREGNSVLCLSNGIGTCGFPIRFLCPPEVSVLTLTGKRDGEGG